MALFFFPDDIVITVKADPTLIQLANRALALAEREEKIKTLTERLCVARKKLALIVAAHPDPDITD